MRTNPRLIPIAATLCAVLFTVSAVQAQSTNVSDANPVTLTNNFTVATTGTTTFFKQSPGGLTFNGAISGGGNGAVLFLNTSAADSGTAFTLSASNSFTALIQLNRGSLVVNNLYALGNPANEVYLNSYVNTTLGNLRFNVSGTFANPINNAQSNFDNTIGVGTNNVTLTGPIYGGGGLTKYGSGSLTITGTNTYQNGTTVSEGTLQVGNGGTTGTLGSGNVTNNASLAFNRSDALTVSGAISGTGTLVQAGTGTTILAGNNSYSGPTLLSAGTLVFSNSGAQTLAGTISGSGALTLAGAGMTTLTGSNTYSAGTMVTGTGGIAAAGGTNLGTGTLTFTTQGRAMNLTAANGVFNNAIVLASGSGTTSLRAQQIVSTNTFNGTISGGSSNSVLYIEGGAGGNNSAFTVLNGTNSFLGTINVFRSPLVLGNASAAGQASILLNANNNAAGDLQFGSGGFSISNNVQLGNSGLLNWIGVASGQGNGISGVLSGNGLTKVGGGTLTLSGNNTYTGATTISAGSLVVSGRLGNGSYAGAIANSSSLVLSNSATQTLSGAISGTGSLTMAGSGTTTLTGANAYTGGTMINAGTLALSNNNANILSGAITVNSGATLRAQGVNVINDTSAMTLNGGTYAMGNNGDYFGSLTMNGNSTVSGTSGAGGAQFILTAGQSSNSTIKTLTATGTNNLVQANIGISSQWGGVGGNANLNFNVVGTSDSLQVSGVIADKAFDGGGNATSGAITKSGQGTLILAGDNTYTGGASILGGTIQVGTGGTTGNITGNDAAIANNGTLIINRAGGFGLGNALSGSGTLIQAGSGTTIVTGNNTYTGATLVRGGTLQVGSSQALGVNSAVTLSNVTGATLNLTNYNSTIAALGGGGASGGNVTLGSGTLTVGNAGGSGTYSGAISGTGGLVKSGSGTQTLAGNNTYTGATIISAGTLQAGANQALARNSSVTLSNAAGATLNLAGYNQTIDALGGGGASGGNVTLGSGTLTVGNAGGSGTYSGVISGTGGLVKSGSGTQTLAGNNSYTGTTTISGGGVLALSSSGTISSSTNINLGMTNSRGTFDVSAKGASGYTIGTGQTLSGNGTITTGANTGRAVTVNGSLNPGNSIGTQAVRGDLLLGSSAQSIFELGTAGTLASPGLSDRVTVTGNLTLGGTLSLLDNAGDNGQGMMGPGVYRLFTYGGSLSGSFSNTPPSLIYNNALYRPSLVTATLGVVDLNIAQFASGSFFTNAISLAYHVTNSGSVTALLGISNTVAAGGGSLGVDLVGNSGSASITGGTNFSNLAPGASTNLTLSVAKSAVAGATTGMAVFAMNDTGVGGGSAPVSLGSNSIAYTATGYNLASAVLGTNNVNLGRIHAGGSFGSANLIVSNSAAISAFTETLGASLGASTGGVAGSGSVTGLAAGSSDTGLSVTLNDNTAGAKSGTIAVALTSQEVGGSGLGNTGLAGQTVNVSGFVYTGQGVWNTTGGSWSDFGNWQQAGGVAGIDGALSANDTATFGAGGSGSVTLDGTAPSLQSITFSNSTSSYEIAQGSGSGGSLTLQAGNTNASVNVQAGSHAITAAVNAASDITMNTASNSQLTLGGAVSGVGGITQAGAGTTILTASNSYTGLTKVSGGTLAVNGSIAGNLQVEAGATLKGSGTIAGDATIAGIHSPGNSPGIQNFGGNLDYQPGSTMLWQLADNTTANSPLAYDQVMVGGNLAFNGGTTLVLSFNDVGSVVNWTDSLWASDQSWTIYQVTGSTTGLEHLSLADYTALLDAYGNDFATTLAGSSFSISQNGQNVTLTYTVPEPSTYALIGLGGLALVVAYRRKRG